MRDRGAATTARVLAVMLAAGAGAYPTGSLRAQGARGTALSATAADAVAVKDVAGKAESAGDDALLPAIWAAMNGGLGPVRWGGSTGIGLRSQQSGNNATQRQHEEFLNLNAATYLFQPWFAQVSGGIGLRTSSANGAGGAQSTSVTGDGTALVFPMSRFPFFGYFNVSDSRSSGEAIGSEYTSKRYGVRQNYRPVQGAETYSASYDRSTLSGSFGDDTVDSLSGVYTNVLGPHGINASGNWSRNTRALGEGSTLDRYTARHNWRPSDTLQVENLATFSRSDFHLLSAGAITENRSQVTQLNSFGTWRPETEKPLTVSGGLRYFQAETMFSDASSNAQSFSGNVAANYSLTPYTNTFASAAVTQATVGAASVFITSQSVGASHAPETWMIGNYRYGWNTSAAMFNQTGGEAGGRQSVNTQVGHTLTRTDTLGNHVSLTTSYRQSYSATMDTGNDPSQTLSHSASATWQKSPTTASSVYLSASASDSRTMGNNESEFQMLNLQMSGQLQFSRAAYGNANLTLQTYRQSSANTPDSGFRNSAAGTISYQHGRAFGVPQLRYSLLGQVNTLPSDTRLTGDVNALRDTVTYSVEQRLDYNIGRLETRLLFRIAETNNRRNSLIFLRISRRLGDF